MSVTFLPDPATLLLYALACVTLFATPGPDMSLSLSRTLTGGRRAGMAAMLGAAAGCLVHTLLAALGVSALLAASSAAFLVLKVVGALYLLWLAVDALRRGSALRVRADGSGAEASLVRTFLLGVGVNLANPKVVLFFVTFLPQFVDAADPHAAAKLVFLGLFFVVFTLPMGALLILGAARVTAALARNPRLLRAIDVAFAGLFGAFAIKILTTQAR